MSDNLRRLAQLDQWEAMVKLFEIISGRERPQGYDFNSATSYLTTYPSLDTISELLSHGDIRDLVSKSVQYELNMDDKLKYVEVQSNHVKLLKELWSEKLSKERKSQLIQELGNPIYNPDIKPYSNIPNVSEFKIDELQEWHPILKAFQIEKREGSPLFTKEPGRNLRANRYIKYQFLLLHKYRHNPKLFWKIADKLLHKSIAFRLSLLIKIKPKWYKNMELKKVYKLLSAYTQINFNSFEYKRLMIPKPNGKMRSLGVPTVEWRMYQTGLNMILCVLTDIFNHPNQHGFRPGRGTDTAWKQLHAQVLGKGKANWILDYDLKEFFDRCNLSKLSEILKTLDLPKDLLYHIILWSRTMPSNMDRSTDIEYESKEQLERDKKNYNNLPEEELKVYEKEYQKESNENKFCFYNGVAQGSPLSPTLSTLMLVKTLMLKTNGCYYADDGKLFGSTVQELNEAKDLLKSLDPDSGIQAHITGEKGYTLDKENNKWIKDMKFVGKVFEPNSLHPENKDQAYQGGLLVNATRTPKPFKFDKADVFSLAISYDLFKRLKHLENRKKGITEAINLEDYLAAGADDGMLKIAKNGLGSITSGLKSRRKD
jgi:retron-type reverse transcriptase